MNIIELSEQAGLAYKTPNGKYWIDAGYPDVHLERFAELVAEQTHTNNKAKWYQEGYEAGQRDERESCADLCEHTSQEYQQYTGQPYKLNYTCAAAIRARGEK